MSGALVSRLTVPVVDEKPVMASVRLAFSNVSRRKRVPLGGVAVGVLVGVAVAPLVAVGVAVGTVPVSGPSIAPLSIVILS